VGPGAPAAADPARIRGQEPADGAERADPGRAGGDRRRRPDPPGRRTRGGIAMRHLLSIADLERDDVERILETAAALQGVEGKLPTLQGKLVLSLFFESSTRTPSTFEPP